jgi:hypothetical protein
VVVIVPTFAQRCHGDHKVLSRADVSDKVIFEKLQKLMQTETKISGCVFKK